MSLSDLDSLCGWLQGGFHDQWSGELKAMSQAQRVHINKLLAPSDIYSFHLVTPDYKPEEETAVVTWLVQTEDTLYEENGVQFDLVETIDREGNVISDVRTYRDSWPSWVGQSAFEIEYIHYPCTVRCEGEERIIHGREDV